jgi:hypothetical protein
MLEIIAGVVLFLSIAIVAALGLSALYVFIGTVGNVDSDAFSDED